MGAGGFALGFRFANRVIHGFGVGAAAFAIGELGGFADALLGGDRLLVGLRFELGQFRGARASGDGRSRRGNGGINHGWNWDHGDGLDHCSRGLGGGQFASGLERDGVVLGLAAGGVKLGADAGGGFFFGEGGVAIRGVRLRFGNGADALVIEFGGFLAGQLFGAGLSLRIGGELEGGGVLGFAGFAKLLHFEFGGDLDLLEAFEFRLAFDFGGEGDLLGANFRGPECGGFLGARDLAGGFGFGLRFAFGGGEFFLAGEFFGLRFANRVGFDLRFLGGGLGALGGFELYFGCGVLGGLFERQFFGAGVAGVGVGLGKAGGFLNFGGVRGGGGGGFEFCFLRFGGSRGGGCGVVGVGFAFGLIALLASASSSAAPLRVNSWALACRAVSAALSRAAS